MPVPEIPHDVIELILDEVCRDEDPKSAMLGYSLPSSRAIRTLGACCGISRSFLAPARERLYRNLVLTMRVQEEYITLELAREQTELLCSLAVSPLLATLPRTIIFSSSFEGWHEESIFNSEAPYDVMNNALRLCPNISSLVLRTMREGFADIARTIIDIAPALTKLDLRFEWSGPSVSEGTATLLRALPHLQHLVLYDTRFEAQDVVEPAPFHLRSLTIRNHHWIPHQQRVFPFLTSASTTTLVSATFPVHNAVHALSPFLSLTTLDLSLPHLTHTLLPEAASLLADFSSQLDAVPSSVRHLTLHGAWDGYPPSFLEASEILSRIRPEVHYIYVGGLNLSGAYVAEFFERSSAELEWKVFDWWQDERRGPGVGRVVELGKERGIDVR